MTIMLMMINQSKMLSKSSPKSISSMVSRPGIAWHDGRRRRRGAGCIKLGATGTQLTEYERSMHCEHWVLCAHKRIIIVVELQCHFIHR